jgi:hypothetical protein
MSVSRCPMAVSTSLVVGGSGGAGAASMSTPQTASQATRLLGKRLRCASLTGAP